MSSIPQKKFTLYLYANRANGKRYIGVTNNPARRAREHASGRACARALARAVKKYGIEAFDYKVLAIFDDVAAAAYHEQAAIRAFGTLAPDGYNLTAGAPCTVYGGPASAETRAKISSALMGKAVSAETRARLSASHDGQHNFLGHSHSAETRAKISAAKKGSPAWNKGMRASPETRAKIGAANRRRVVSPETRAKMSAARIGNKNSLGRVLSAETRAKISAANRRRKRKENKP